MEPSNPAPVVQSTPKARGSAGMSVALVVLLVVAAAGVGLALKAQSQAQKAETQANKATQTTQDMNARVTKIETADQYVGTQVNHKENQAVFLSSGQVYFGSITHLTPSTMTLENIFYLSGDGSFDKDSQTVNDSSGSVSLIKLGKELHSPEDKMIIETKNVEFWENLQNDGQVSKAMAEYAKQNPNN